MKIIILSCGISLHDVDNHSSPQPTLYIFNSQETQTELHIKCVCMLFIYINSVTIFSLVLYEFAQAFSQTVYIIIKNEFHF